MIHALAALAKSTKHAVGESINPRSGLIDERPHRSNASVRSSAGVGRAFLEAQTFGMDAR